MRALPALLAALVLTGCSSLVDRATSQFADDLESAILAYNEPATVGQGLPAYLLLLEARLQSRPDDAALRLTTARLTGSYASLFVDELEPDAVDRLHQRALNHARVGACEASPRLCDLGSQSFDDFDERIASLRPADLDAAYGLATTWTGWIDAHSDDFNALADLPRVEALLRWVADRDPGHDDGAVWLYLAVLNSQRPPAAGGRPDKARQYFQKAEEHSRGRNLLVKVLMADSYARLLFDRDLFVELLEAVRDARVDDPDYQLVNQVARSRAARLLNRTEAIFD